MSQKTVMFVSLNKENIGKSQHLIFRVINSIDVLLQYGRTRI